MLNWQPAALYTVYNTNRPCVPLDLPTTEAPLYSTIPPCYILHRCMGIVRKCRKSPPILNGESPYDHSRGGRGGGGAPMNPHAETIGCLEGPKWGSYKLKNNFVLYTTVKVIKKAPLSIFEESLVGSVRAWEHAVWFPFQSLVSNCSALMTHAMGIPLVWIAARARRTL